MQTLSGIIHNFKLLETHPWNQAADEKERIILRFDDIGHFTIDEPKIGCAFLYGYITYRM